MLKTIGSMLTAPRHLPSHRPTPRRLFALWAGVALLAVLAAPVPAGGAQEPATDKPAGAEGTAGAGAADGAEQLSVFVSVLPQQYFVERIAGDRAAVTVLVPPGSPPATYDPTPRQVNAIGKADVWFRIGVPFENSFLPEIRDNLPNLRIVDTRQGIDLRSLEDHSHDEGEHEEEENHGDEEHHGDDEHHDGDHEESGAIDPHIWLGPEEVQRQAATIRDTLVSIDPDNSDAYRQGYEAFMADVTDLQAELETTLAPLRGESFFVYHPSFGYLLDGYGIEQVAIETGGGEPTPQQMRELIRRGQEEDVSVVFVQPEFSQTAARRVAEALDAEMIEVNPLAPDWLANMRRIAERIRQGVEDASSSNGG